MKLIDGVELLTHVIHKDERGSLVALEEHDLPFTPRRIFYITAANASTIRGGHAGTSEELIIAMTGAVTIELDNGLQQTNIRLADNADNNESLWVRPGVWLRLREFAPGTALLVVASLPYAEAQHFDHPKPLYHAD
jgi:hypothetical protein